MGEDSLPARSGQAAADALPYKVELWDEARLEVERVLARLSSLVLAHAAYEAAVSEHVNRRITLRQETRLIADNG